MYVLLGLLQLLIVHHTEGQIICLDVDIHLLLYIFIVRTAKRRVGRSFLFRHRYCTPTACAIKGSDTNKLFQRRDKTAGCGVGTVIKTDLSAKMGWTDTTTASRSTSRRSVQLILRRPGGKKKKKRRRAGEKVREPSS